MATWRTVVRLNHAALGGTGTNTWHLRTDGIDLAAMNELMGYVETFYTDINGYFPDSAAIVWDGTFEGVGADEGEHRESAPWTVVGGTAGGCLPPSQSIVVGWKSESGGKRGKGRTFLGPMHVNTLEADGTPAGATLTAIRETAAELISSQDDFGDGALGVWSREDQVLRDFASATVRNVFGSLRSRRD